MNVSMNKKYTLDGEEFTVLTVTRPCGIPGAMPVAGHVPSGRIFCFRLNGSNEHSTQRLVEVSPYADFKIDEPVMVRDDKRHTWQHAYFAGVEDDKALAFCDGATKWSSLNESTCWLQCRRPTAEELAA